MNVRTYAAKDAERLINLWSKVFPNDPPHNDPTLVLQKKLAVDNLIFVIEDGADLIGACMAGYDGHRGWLYSVAVLPESRRAGAGTQLVKKAMQALNQLGCQKINLQIRADNTEVKSFYQSLGFDIEERLSMGYLNKQGD